MAGEVGGLGIVVANAGIELLGQDDRVDRLRKGVWDRLIAVNMTGQFLTAKHGARHLLAAGGGAIVCTGSNCAYLGMATNEPAYSASKGGILAMMKVMAIDYARLNIRVNMIVPGFIDTPMNAPVMNDPKELAYWSNQVPIGRAGTADECASAISFLASDEASYCIGATLVVDGGTGVHIAARTLRGASGSLRELPLTSSRSLRARSGTSGLARRRRSAGRPRRR